MEPRDPLPVHCLPDANWTCQGCGLCCERFHLGPMSLQDIARLQTAGISTLWPPAAGGAWYESRSRSPGIPGWYLARRNGACIFLDAEKSCALHRLLGEEYKPHFCRLFPLHLVPGRAEVRATVRPTCPRWHASRHDGAPLGPQVEDLLPLAGAVPRALPDLIVLLPGLGVDRGSWEAAEPALLRLAAATAGTPEARVAALRRAVQRALGRPDPPTAPAALAQARGGLLEILRDTLAELDPGLDDPDPRAVLLRRCREWLRGLGPDTPPSGCDPEAEDYLGLVLRSLVFADGPRTPGGLPVCLGTFLLETWIARAQPAADPHPTAMIADRLATWQTVAAHGAVRAALGRAHPLLADLFLHADGP